MLCGGDVASQEVAVLLLVSPVPLMSLHLSLPFWHGGGMAVMGPAACMPVPLISVLCSPACFPCLSFPYHASHLPVVFSGMGGWQDVVGAGVW